MKAEERYNNDMHLEELLKEARSVWGDLRMDKSEIAIALGVIYGDICRQIRDAAVDDEQLKKEFGNVIFSMVRWMDDLNFDAEECITRAMQAQKAYVEKGGK